MSILKKYFEHIIVFLLTLLVFFPNLMLFCSPRYSSDFDAQNFLVWDYSAQSGAIPYRDVVYYYGLLLYFKQSSLVAHLFYILLTPVLFFSCFLLVKKLSPSKVFSYFVLFLLLYYFYSYLSLMLINRYGTGIGVVTLISYLVYTFGLSSLRTHFWIGVLIASTFSLINDQGIYSGIVYAFLLFSYPLLSQGNLNLLDKETIQKATTSIVKAGLSFTGGFILGILPFATYLYMNQSLSSFFFSLGKLSTMMEFAKIPVTAHLLTPMNLFVFAVMCISFFSLIYQYFFEQKNFFSLHNYISLGLLILLLLLQQKNFMRPLSAELQMASILLLIVLWTQLQHLLLKVSFKAWLVTLYSLIALPIILVLAGFRFDPKTLFIHLQQRWTQLSTIEISLLQNWSGTASCQARIFDNEKLPLTPSQRKVIAYLEQLPETARKVFIFPSDPVPYISLKQTPPPYFNAYDASPLFAQRKNIEYLEKENVNFIMYNIGHTEYDTVPHYLRNSEFLKYVMNNYEYDQRIENYALLKRKSSTDFYSEKMMHEVPELFKHFMEPSLSQIPKLQGKLYQNQSEDNKKVLIRQATFEELNQQLRTSPISSQNTYVVLSSETATPEQPLTMTFTTTEKKQTTVSFQGCDTSSPCIINVSKLPLFFQEKSFDDIQISTNFKGKVELIQVDESSPLW